MSEAVHRVSVIGLGRMGSEIARNIVRAGFEVTVHNRTAAKAQPLVQAGARAAATAGEAVAGAEVVVTNLMDDASVLETVQGADGILAGLAPGAIHVGTTTISPRAASEIAALHEAHGSHYVAAPVLGRPDAAAAGQLRTFAAGEASAIERCRPVLDAYCSGVIDVGREHRVANSLKLAVNYIIASCIELFGQLFAFAEKSDIDSDLLQAVVTTLLAQPALPDYAERIRCRRFDEVGFALTAGFKDVRLMLEAAADVQAPLPYANIVHDKQLAALANGLGDKDWSAIYEIARRNAGLE